MGRTWEEAVMAQFQVQLLHLIRETEEKQQTFSPDNEYLNQIEPRVFFPPITQQPLLGQGHLIIETSQSHSDTPYLMEFIWMSDQHNKQTSTCTSHNIHNRQTSTPPVGFEPATPATNQPQTHAFDRMVNGIRETSAY
jgi:hypothetical protein